MEGFCLTNAESEHENEKLKNKISKHKTKSKAQRKKMSIKQPQSSRINFDLRNITLSILSSYTQIPQETLKQIDCQKYVIQPIQDLEEWKKRSNSEVNDILNKLSNTLKVDLAQVASSNQEISENFENITPETSASDCAEYEEIILSELKSIHDGGDKSSQHISQLKQRLNDFSSQHPVKVQQFQDSLVRFLPELEQLLLQSKHEGLDNQKRASQVQQQVLNNVKERDDHLSRVDWNEKRLEEIDQLISSKNALILVLLGKKTDSEQEISSLLKKIESQRNSLAQSQSSLSLIDFQIQDLQKNMYPIQMKLSEEQLKQANPLIQQNTSLQQYQVQQQQNPSVHQNLAQRNLSLVQQPNNQVPHRDSNLDSQSRLALEQELFQKSEQLSKLLKQKEVYTADISQITIIIFNEQSVLTLKQQQLQEIHSQINETRLSVKSLQDENAQVNEKLTLLLQEEFEISDKKKSIKYQEQTLGKEIRNHNNQEKNIKENISLFKDLFQQITASNQRNYFSLLLNSITKLYDNHLACFSNFNGKLSTICKDSAKTKKALDEVSVLLKSENESVQKLTNEYNR